MCLLFFSDNSINLFLYSNIYMMLQELPFVHFMKQVIKQVFIVFLKRVSLKLILKLPVLQGSI